MSLILAVQDIQVQDTTIPAAIITAVGLIIVAAIGIFTARITSGARKGARESSESAAISAQAAEDYANALKSKDAFIDSLEERLRYIEKRLEECERRERDRRKET